MAEAPPKERKKVGAPKKPEDELQKVRKEVNFTHAEIAIIEEAIPHGLPFATWLHKLAMDAAQGKDEPKTPEIDWAMVGTQVSGFTAPLIGRVPQGPWQESIPEDGPQHTISDEDADLFKAAPGDVFVQALGESMKEAGVPDGALVLVDPVKPGIAPADNSIVVAEVKTADDKYHCTLKYWFNTYPHPTLRNGRGEDVPFPEKPQEIRAVAIAKGIIGRV